MARRAADRSPRLRQDAEEGRDRRVSWLELFFDLVFVVLIAKLSHDLEEHLDLAGVVRFLLMMLPIWWIWMGTVVYQERFESDDVVHRLLVLTQVMGVGVLATTIAPDGGGTAFALAYVAVRGISVLAWYRAGRANPSVRLLIARETIGYTLSLSLWLASAAAPDRAALTLRVVGLAIDLATPAVVQASTTTRFPRISSERAAERFGLFTIIVLGESLARSIAGVTNHAALRDYALLLCAVALVGTWWWLYFDRVADGHPALDGAPGFAWAYTHLPLFAGVVIAAAAVTPMISGSAHGDGFSGTVFGGGCALVLLSLSALTAAHGRSRADSLLVRALAISGPAVAATGAIAPWSELVLGAALTASALCVVVSARISSRL